GGMSDDILIGDGNDNTLDGSLGNDILLGNDGHDRLLGGAGRDLLIGGLGHDNLSGGLEDGLLIAGATGFDTQPFVLQLLLAEWVRTDLGYSQRIDHLRHGGGFNGPYVLNSGTVHDDSDVDVLRGDDGQDWFWAQVGSPPKDSLDRKTNEQVN